MTKLNKIFLGIIALVIIGIAFYSIRPPSSPSLGATSLANPAYVVTSTATQATTTLYTFAGVLHTLTVTKPVTGSVITIYDSATTTAPTIAPIVVTIPASSTPFTMTFDAIFNNGVTIQQSTATSSLTVTYQQN